MREDTAHRVYDAAHLVVYHAAPLIGQRVQAELPRPRLGVVLHKEKQPFHQNFRAELVRVVAAAPGVRASVQVVFAHS